MVLRKTHHFARIASSVESRGGTAPRVPDEVRVDGHTVIVRVKLRDALGFINFLRTPLALGEFIKRSRSKTKKARNPEKPQPVKRAPAQRTNFLRTDTRLLGQFSIGNPQAALRFSDDIGPVVFQRNHSVLL